MTAPRLIQNFRGCRGVLWGGGDAEALGRALARLGLSLVRTDPAAPAEAGGARLDPDRDVVFLDADQALDPALLLPAGSTLPDAPVIGLVGVEAPSRLRLLAEAGATAMLRKPVQGALVYSALFLGVNTYRRLRSAETRLAAGDRKRRGRRLLIKAVVALVQARGLGDDAAYAELRRESMRRRLDLEAFCEALFAPGSPFPAAWPLDRPSDRSFDPVPHPRGDDPNAQDADAGRRDRGPDRADAAVDGAGRRPDQARRA